MTPEQKVLAKAADYIESHGWCRRQSHSRGRVCALGAIDSVRAPEVVKDAAINLLLRNIDDHYVSKWNDEQPSKWRVIAKLRDIARKQSTAVGT